MTADYLWLPWRVMDDPRPSRRIHAALRQRIGDGTYPAGAHLNIGLLADEFDVTRTTVGKALRLAEADGLVELFTGVGWYVKEPPPGEGEGS